MNPDVNRVEELALRAALVRKRIGDACVSCGRSAASVRLVWVSKTHPIGDVEAAIVAGAVDFGENKVQEGLDKFSVPRPGIELHLIGPVQSNKWRKAAGIAQWIHSVGSREELSKYDAICGELGKTLNVLVQINTSGEASKSGLSMENADAFFENWLVYGNLKLRGLMTIGTNSGVPEDSRVGFAWLRGLRDRLQSRGGAFEFCTELSMGMTDDMEIAVAEGSTMVRVGTAIFGRRTYSLA